MSRPTHDRLVALRQTSWIPREGKEGGGKTWPASFLSFLNVINDLLRFRGRLTRYCAELCRKIFENMQAGTVERSKKRAAG